MELIFITVGGAILGIAARYSLPGRHKHGSVLIPAIGAGVAALVWVALTWLGMPWDGGWIWLVALLAAGAVSVATAMILAHRRMRSDDEMLERLSRA